ncbi:MAG: 3,4-dihydroxy-2-butanone-4-phosphate synthase, partial [Pseudomonadota bacterium]|nr:3,4-dihydroxy-2-butanone-4-phosphate synthase [Pseudomonadota bacterium]
LRNDRVVKPSLSSKIDTIGGGEFKSIVYVNSVDKSEHMALVKGNVEKKSPVLVRMHAFNMFDDIYSVEKTLELHKAMEIIDGEGCGAVVMLRNPSKTYISDQLKNEGDEPEITFRGYGIGAQILLDLGIHEMIVLSNTERTLIGLKGYGLKIIERRPIKIKKSSPVPVRDKFYE